jgi:hypothetical protein
VGAYVGRKDGSGVGANEGSIEIVGDKVGELLKVPLVVHTY